MPALVLKPSTPNLHTEQRIADVLEEPKDIY